jgi:filamentous hemagglutinin family protein
MKQAIGQGWVMIRRCGLNCAGARAAALWLGLLALVGGGRAWCVPEGGQVVLGDAQLSASATGLLVQQQSERAVIEYQSFSLGADEQVRFVQPSAQSVVLNRVLGDSLSRIDGQILANGQVFLSNPRGLVFGQGSQVNVQGFLATSLQLSNEDFLAGQGLLAGEGGDLLAEGQINARWVSLVAPQLHHTGQIQAEQVHLAASQALQFTDTGSAIALLEPVPQSLQPQGLQEAAVPAAHRAQLRNDGLVRASRWEHRGGRIVLLADGDIQQAGQLAAPSAAGAQGHIQLAGERVAHLGQMTVSVENAGSAAGASSGQGAAFAAGAAGPGDAGQIELLAEDTLVLAPGSSAQANAAGQGQGGRVLAISQGQTQFYEGAALAARGGSQGGDGGFVEVSGRGASVAGTVDVGASQGRAGLWYIDPIDIVIRTGGVNNSFNGSGEQLWQNPGGSLATIATGAISAALALGDVTISTQGAGTGAGNVILDDVVDFNTTARRTLRLLADGNVHFNGQSGFTNSRSGEVTAEIRLGGSFSMDTGAALSLNQGRLQLEAQGDIEYAAISSQAAGPDRVSLSSQGGTVRARNGFSQIQVPNGGVSLQLPNDLSLPLSGGISSRDLRVDVGGTLRLTGDSYSQTGQLQLRAQDLVSSTQGRRLRLQADELLIDTEARGGDLQIDTQVNRLGLIHRGTGRITVADLDNLVLTQVSPLRGQSLIRSLSQDIRLGQTLDLQGAQGSLVLEAADDLWLDFSMLDSSGAQNHNLSLSLRSGSEINWSPDATLDLGLGSASVSSGAGINLGGLISRANTPTAISLQAQGDITDSNGTALNLVAPNGGLVIDAGRGLSLVQTDSGLLSLRSRNGPASLSNLGSLRVTQLQAAGDLFLSSQTGDLLLQDPAPLLGGAVQLQSAGALQLPDAGLRSPGAMSLTAGQLRDTNSRVQIEAESLSLQLASGAPATEIQSRLKRVSLASSASSSLSLENAGALVIDALTSAGDLTLSSTENLQLGFAQAQVRGELSLTTLGTGALVSTAAGLASLGGIQLDVHQLLFEPGTASGTAWSLQAPSAQLRLRGGTAPLSINSRLERLRLEQQGTGALQLTNSGSLELDLLQAQGDLQLRTQSGDLRLLSHPASAPNQAGHSLTLIAAEQLQLPASGLSYGGLVQIQARGVQQAGTGALLRAPVLEVQLLGDQPQSLFTETAQLSLTSSDAAQALQVFNTGALALRSGNLAGDFTLSNQGDLDLWNANLTLPGSLAVWSSGSIQVPSQVTSQGSQTWFARELLSATGAWQISAAAVDLSLQAQQTPINLRLASPQLRLAQAGPGALSLHSLGDLQLTTRLAGQDLRLTGDADLRLTPESNRTFGLLDLALQGTLHLPSGAWSASQLRLAAQAWQQEGAGVLQASAPLADITLRDQRLPLNLTGSLAQLSLSAQGSGSLNLQLNGDTQISQLNLDNLAQWQLRSNARLSLPVARLAATERLHLQARDLDYPSGPLSLQSPQVIFLLEQGAARNDLQLQAAQADLHLGEGDLQLTATDPSGLHLRDLDGDGYALQLQNGSANLRITQGNARLDGQLLTQDSRDDTQWRGYLRLDADAGDIILADQTQLSARLQSGSTGTDPALWLRLNDPSTQARHLQLGETAGQPLSLLASGGDLRLDALGPLQTRDPSLRRIDAVGALSLAAENTNNGPRTGSFWLNGSRAQVPDYMRVRENRRVEFITALSEPLSAQTPVNPPLPRDPQQLTRPFTQAQRLGPTLEQVFGQAFGHCQRLTPEGETRCRRDQALKSFLSHWLIGGELPLAQHPEAP